MDLNLAGKLCLVTGASTGIGRAAAIELAREGARVAITARSRPPLDSLAAEIVAAGGVEPIVLTADFGQPDASAALARELLRTVEHVDVLVNNAGGSRPVERPDDDEAWAESMMLNFISVRRLSEVVVPTMVERGWGRVITLTGAIVAKSMNVATAPKAALESWSKSSAAFYASRGITFNCIAPGRIVTPQIMNKVHPSEAARREFIERNIPAGRFGEPEEAAAVIAFLASERASYVNGVTIPVDGGGMRLAF